MTACISRADALAGGLPRYFTGQPCKRGHRAERMVSNYACMACYHGKAAGEPVERRKCSGCEVIFEIMNPQHLYCSDACKKRSRYANASVEKMLREREKSRRRQERLKLNPEWRLEKRRREDARRARNRAIVLAWKLQGEQIERGEIIG